MDLVAESTVLRVAARGMAAVAGLSWLQLSGLCTATVVAYLYSNSTLASTSRDRPCIPFGAVFRILYGLFATNFAQAVLGAIALTKEGEEQAEGGNFGTQQVTQGPPEMRILLVPILGGLFGGNYSFLVWDDDDPQRRAIVVDPADPHVVLQAARREKLDVQLLLTTHWHFDHSAGNRTFKRHLPQIEVAASAGEGGRTPAVTRRLLDLEELTVGRLTVRAHAVPGHTRGSMVYEVFSRAAPDAPHYAFTGDTLFCGGCGALFECSATVLHGSLASIVQRLRPTTKLYPGHEYSAMLLEMLVKKDPNNPAVRTKLAEVCHPPGPSRTPPARLPSGVACAAAAPLMLPSRVRGQVRLKRRNQLPSLPSTLAEELSYNPYLTAGPAQLADMCGAAYDE